MTSLLTERSVPQGCAEGPAAAELGARAAGRARVPRPSPGRAPLALALPAPRAPRRVRGVRAQVTPPAGGGGGGGVLSLRCVLRV